MANIVVRMLGDSSSLERSFKRANASAAGFNKNMTRSGKTTQKSQGALRGLGRTVAIVGGGYLGAAGLSAAVRTSWQEMSESAKVAAQTNAAIKSTGGVANVTARDVDALSASLLRKSGIDDEAIRTGANMLLTFRNIRNETGQGNAIFDEAAKAVLDMDVAMTQGNSTQQSLSKSAIRLGKALNDPVKGVGALARVGIQFTAQEKAKINALVASGDILGAQKLILRELNTEFGGSAAALGGTLPGKIAIARESFKNLGGTLAVQLVPAVTQAVTAITKFISNTKNQKAIIDGFKTALAAVSTTLTVVRTAFRFLSTVMGGSKNAVVLLIGAYVAFKALKVASTVAGMGRSFGILTTRTTAATAATGKFRLSMVGKAGLVAGVGLAAFGITSMILKLTGLDKKLRGVGASAFDAAAKLGLVNDPMSQFKGKTTNPQVLRGLRQRAARLEAKGLSPREAAQAIVRQSPNVALRDAQVAAGVFGSKPTVVHTTVTLDGQVVGKSVTEAQRKGAKRNTTQRRGRLSGR